MESTTAGSTNTITDGNGSNIIVGGAGADTITAGNGSNIIYGGAGNDTIKVGNGGDVIIAGAGSDTVTAGNGSDLFIYALSDHYTVVGSALQSIANDYLQQRKEEIAQCEAIIEEKVRGLLAHPGYHPHGHSSQPAINNA